MLRRCCRRLPCKLRCLWRNGQGLAKICVKRMTTTAGPQNKKCTQFFSSVIDCSWSFGRHGMKSSGFSINNVKYWWYFSSLASEWIAPLTEAFWWMLFIAFSVVARAAGKNSAWSSHSQLTKLPLEDRHIAVHKSEMCILLCFCSFDSLMTLLTL